MKKYLIILAAASGMMLTACTTHYKLTNVSRTRILVDKTYDANPDAKAMAFLAPYKQKVDSIMGPVVGEVAHNMAASRPESDLSNLLPDIFIYMAKNYGEKPDFAVYNMGGIRSAFAKGKVTYGDVLDVAPFENKISFATLTGEKLMELFRQIAHRGGEGVSKGVELVIKMDEKGETGELISARLHGQEIDPQAEYRVTTLNYVLEGNDGMTAFLDGTNSIAPQEASNNTRFLIMNYFREMMAKGIVVDSKVEGRIKVKK